MSKKRFQFYLILSFCAHLLLFLCLNLMQHWKQSSEREKVEISFMSPEEIEKLKKQDIKQQIVDQEEKPMNDEVPTEAKFLSAHNQTVKKQSVAQQKGDFKNLKQKPTPTPTPQKSQAMAAAKPSPQKFDPLADMDRRFKAKQMENIGKNPEERQLEKPTSATANDVSQSPDYLKDVDKGIETLLNTKEFKYYTYFNRIRRQLSQHWEPKVKEKLNAMFRQGRKIASDEDKITKLLITLDKAGLLVKVQILSDSGVRDLDEAAIDAFRAAAPFPNPPKGIVDPDGTVKIRWDFILES